MQNRQTPSLVSITSGSGRPDDRRSWRRGCGVGLVAFGRWPESEDDEDRSRMARVMLTVAEPNQPPREPGFRPHGPHLMQQRHNTTAGSYASSVREPPRPVPVGLKQSARSPAASPVGIWDPLLAGQLHGEQTPLRNTAVSRHIVTHRPSRKSPGYRP